MYIALILCYLLHVAFFYSRVFSLVHKLPMFSSLPFFFSFYQLNVNKKNKIYVHLTMQINTNTLTTREGIASEFFCYFIFDFRWIEWSQIAHLKSNLNLLFFLIFLCSRCLNRCHWIWLYDFGWLLIEVFQNNYAFNRISRCEAK